VELTPPFCKTLVLRLHTASQQRILDVVIAFTFTSKNPLTVRRIVGSGIRTERVGEDEVNHSCYSSGESAIDISRCSRFPGKEHASFEGCQHGLAEEEGGRSSEARQVKEERLRRGVAR
jgi:hypothetical protein